MQNSQVNDVLLQILKDNTQTDCGKKWNFESVRTVGAFQNTVPLTGYDNYAPLVELTTRIGEKDIFTALPLAGYALTSGTTGVPRLIPCTKKHLQSYVDAFEKMSVKGSTLLLFESMPRTFKYADQAELDSISGMVLSEVQKKIRDASHKRLIGKGAYTSPIELLITKEVMDSVHLRLLFALADKRVEQIIAPFTWGVLEVFNYMENHWQELVDDIENGTISENVKVSEELASKLKAKFSKNVKRATELRAIFEQGFETPVATKLWPNLNRVISAGTGSFAIYTEKLSRYLGDIPVINGLYASSEALVGICMDAGSEQYTLNEENVFCEFIPVDDTEKVLTSEELEIGKAYEVVVTNNSGFYRYRLGDVIRVADIKDGKILITYEYRVNQTHSFENEKVNEKHILSVVQKLEDKYSIEINDYCYWADYDKNAYTIFIEPVQYGNTTEVLSKVALADLEKDCDSVLSEVNPMYADLRKNGTLTGCQFVVLQPQTHLLYRDVLRYRRKTAPDQLKPVRLLDNPVKEKFFFSMIDRDMHTTETVDYYIGRYRKK